MLLYRALGKNFFAGKEYRFAKLFGLLTKTLDFPQSHHIVWLPTLHTTSGVVWPFIIPQRAERQFGRNCVTDSQNQTLPNV